MFLRTQFIIDDDFHQSFRMTASRLSLIDVCNNSLLSAWQNMTLGYFKSIWKFCVQSFLVALTRILMFSADAYGVLSSANFATSMFFMIINRSQRLTLKKWDQV